MFESARAKHLCFVILLGLAACRDVGIPDVCLQKISPQLQKVLLDAGSDEKQYRVVIRLSDSSGVSHVAPSINIAGNSVATGFLTAAEIRKLCVLEQIRFIDLPKRYHKLDQN